MSPVIQLPASAAIATNGNGWGKERFQTLRLTLPIYMLVTLCSETTSLEEYISAWTNEQPCTLLGQARILRLIRVDLQIPNIAECASTWGSQWVAASGLAEG